MIGRPSRRTLRRARQAGTTTVEFAIVAVAFFLIVLGAIEMSRLLFTWSSLDSVTQRAARLAAVCSPDSAAVANAAVLREPTATTGGLLPDFDSSNLDVDYLDSAYAVTANPSAIQYVRVSIVDYQHRMALPFIPSTLLTSPPFTTTIPAESLGYNPEAGTVTCFGT